MYSYSSYRSILLNFYARSHSKVVQNDLSGSDVVSLKHMSAAMMVTGSLQGDMRNKPHKFSDVKESVVKQPLQQATPPILSNSENSSRFQQVEELHFLSCVQRQTETFSNTASKSNSIVSSQVTISSRHMMASIGNKVKSKSVSTGMSLLAILVTLV